MYNECIGACFEGGFGVVHIESFDVDKTPPRSFSE